MRSFLALCLLLACAVGRADEAAETGAKQLFLDGKAAYEQGAYERAHQLFERSYLVSHHPELLFNMSSALQRMERPREAADKLRAYLRVVPTDDDRPMIEQRIRALDEEQRILDDRRAQAAAEQRVAPAAHRRRALAIGLGVVAGVVGAVAVGVGLGLGLSTSALPYTPSTVGAHPGTF